MGGQASGRFTYSEFPFTRIQSVVWRDGMEARSEDKTRDCGGGYVVCEHHVAIPIVILMLDGQALGRQYYTVIRYGV